MPCLRRNGRNSSSVISPARNLSARSPKASISCLTVASCCNSSSWRVSIIILLSIGINVYRLLEIARGFKRDPRRKTGGGDIYMLCCGYEADDHLPHRGAPRRKTGGGDIYMLCCGYEADDHLPH